MQFTKKELEQFRKNRETIKKERGEPAAAFYENTAHNAARIAIQLLFERRYQITGLYDKFDKQQDSQSYA